MHDDLQTDEYTISISREMTVCRNMIDRQKKELARFEKRFDMSTEQMLAGKMPAEGSDARDMEAWCQEYEGLRAWRQKLREYEEVNNSLSR